MKMSAGERPTQRRFTATLHSSLHIQIGGFVRLCKLLYSVHTYTLQRVPCLSKLHEAPQVDQIFDPFELDQTLCNTFHGVTTGVATAATTAADSDGSRALAPSRIVHIVARKEEVFIIGTQLTKETKSMELKRKPPTAPGFSVLYTGSFPHSPQVLCSQDSLVLLQIRENLGTLLLGGGQVANHVESTLREVVALTVQNGLE